MSLKYNPKLIKFAKNLRKNMTPQEKHLWYDFLADYPVRFQRQKTIDNFIADFYCHKAKLIIEIDGGEHYTSKGKRYDALRTEVLVRYGLKVLRYSNSEVDSKFNCVCISIDKAVKERLANDCIRNEKGN